MCKTLTGKKAQNIIARVEEPFKQLPHLPASLTNFFVKIAPWGVALGGVFSITGAIASLRLSFGMGSISKVINNYLEVSPIYFLLSAVLMLVIAFLAFKAFGPLKERKMEGWIYIFWSNIVSVVHSLLGLIFIYQSGFNLVISALIGFYLLFEIKPAYEGKITQGETKKKKD